jgi:SanA protein
LKLAIVATLLPPLGLLSSRVFSAWQSRGRIFSASEVPNAPVAIVFGALIDSDGTLSAMLADRVAMAAQLYHAGKVKVLLLTGDNHIDSYNEPESMRKYALELGVPYDAIVLDYAGFRTYDSCYRARDIFKVSNAILVSQAFHLDRALMICNSLGVSAVGVAADVVRPEGYTADSMRYCLTREFPSTLVAILDLARGAKPRFLGDPLPIFTGT